MGEWEKGRMGEREKGRKGEEENVEPKADRECSFGSWFGPAQLCSRITRDRKRTTLSPGTSKPVKNEHITTKFRRIFKAHSPLLQVSHSPILPFSHSPCLLVSLSPLLLRVSSDNYTHNLIIQPEKLIQLNKEIGADAPGMFGGYGRIEFVLVTADYFCLHDILF